MPHYLAGGIGALLAPYPVFLVTPPPSRGRGAVTGNRTRSHHRYKRSAKKAKLSPSGFSLHEVVLTLLVMIAVTLGTFFFVIPIMLQDYRDGATLQMRGVATTARAVRIVKHSGSARSGATYKLDFMFRAGSLPSPIMTQAYITAHEAEVVRIPSSVPIIYDPVHPSLAALNISDEVHRRYPLFETIGWMALLFVILAVAWAGQIALLISTLRERRARHGR